MVRIFYGCMSTWLPYLWAHTWLWAIAIPLPIDSYSTLINAYSLACVTCHHVIWLCGIPHASFIAFCVGCSCIGSSSLSHLTVSKSASFCLSFSLLYRHVHCVPYVSFQYCLIGCVCVCDLNLVFFFLPCVFTFCILATTVLGPSLPCRALCAHVGAGVFWCLQFVEEGLCYVI